jgi:hypothetical protein
MTNLSASDLTKLTVLIDGQPRGRLATMTKTVERLTKTFTGALGDPDAAKKVLDRAMLCETYGGAEAILRSALGHPDPAPEAASGAPDQAPAKTKATKEKAPRPERKPQAAARARSRLQDLRAEAIAGNLPAPPDFSAPTHVRFRGKLEGLIALATQGDIEGLREVTINPVSSSPKALARYRDLCVTALEARSRTEA